MSVLTGFLFNSLNQFFPILSTMPTPNRSSFANKIEDRYRNFPSNRNKKRIYMPRIDLSTGPDNITTVLALAENAWYQAEGRREFASHRQTSKQKFINFYKQIK